ncbi:L,D-transpeptidase, partial [Patescibacteria group bacterium]|nr:L,D-transpeptidase [Patescibacteria group bacterium]
LKKENISPREAVIIDFSFLVLRNTYKGKIQILPEAEVDFQWKDSGRQLIIWPQKFWQPETKYQISFSEGRNALFFPIKSFALNFSTLTYPKIKSFLPADGAQDIVFDIEDPVTIEFDKSVADFLVKFTVDPFGDLAYQNNPEKTQFKILPKEKSKEGETYRFKIYIKYRSDTDENYKEIYNSSFETLPLPPASWEKDFAIRLIQAKKFTRAKIKAGKYIDINLAVQILSTFENGKIIDSFLVSSGKRGMETPKGQYAIRNKTPRAWSKVYGLYMPFWMAIVPDGKFGMHELPEWPGGYKEGANHLGIPVSHGCVRLGVGPAKTVYDWAEIGTPIVVY